MFNYSAIVLYGVRAIHYKVMGTMCLHILCIPLLRPRAPETFGQSIRVSDDYCDYYNWDYLGQDAVGVGWRV